MHKLIFLSILIIGYSRLMAQDQTGQLVNSGKGTKMHVAFYNPCAGRPATPAQSKFSLLLKEPHFKGLATQFIKPDATARSFFLAPNPGVQNDSYRTQQGWVCRQEWKLEKLTGVPFRFRLGSKEQVDWLEGKTLPH